MVRENVFKCTSVKLKKWMMEKGFEYFNVFVNDQKITIWEFAKTPKFKDALEEWTTLRQSSN